jgi:ATP-dependent Clp protease ATP-binding subunit ClpB
MTSNIGSQILLENPDFESAKEEVNQVLREYFKPELLNRIDEIITFNPLSKEILNQIVDKFIGLLNQRLAEQRISVKLTEAAHGYIADEGYDPKYGARPLRRFIQRVLETQLARGIIEGKILPDSQVTVDYENDELQLKF